MHLFAGIDDLAEGLAAVEGENGEEVDEAPPEVDPDEVLEDRHGGAAAGEEFEGGGSDGAGVVAAEVVVEDVEAGRAGEHEEDGGDGEGEEGEAGTGAGEDHEEAGLGGEAAALVVGEAAEGPELDVLGATGEATAAEGVAVFVDEDGDEADQHPEADLDHALTVSDLVGPAAEEKGGQPEPGFDEDGDAEKAEVDHGADPSRVGRNFATLRRKECRVAVGLWWIGMGNGWGEGGSRLGRRWAVEMGDGRRHPVRMGSCGVWSHG